MAKVSPGEDDKGVLYRGDTLTIRAMRRRDGSLPAADWYDGLDARGKGQFQSAARTIETTFQSGRPPAGRWEKVDSSSTGLRELKITKPGGTAPHLRALGIRDRGVVWLAVGFTKQKNRLEKGDVRSGDNIHKEWQQEVKP